MSQSVRRHSRREAMRLLAATVLATALQGHTPYAQWTMYRKRNLFIVASRTDARATALAQAIAEGIAAELPESHARFTRAADPLRLASLLKTGQLEVAVIALGEAEQMLAGTGSFAAIGPVPLRRLAMVGEHLVATVADFRDRHAFLLAQALDGMAERLGPPRADAPPVSPVPDHPGTLAYHSGHAVPAANDANDPPHPHSH